MTDRELMQQALDALEGYARNCRCEGGGAPCDAAEALRARLAQPEREWQRLTDEQIQQIEMSASSKLSAIYLAEAQLKGKNAL